MPSETNFAHTITYQSSLISRNQVIETLQKLLQHLPTSHASSLPISLHQEVFPMNYVPLFLPFAFPYSHFSLHLKRRAIACLRILKTFLGFFLLTHIKTQLNC